FNSLAPVTRVTLFSGACDGRQGARLQVELADAVAPRLGDVQGVLPEKFTMKRLVQGRFGGLAAVAGLPGLASAGHGVDDPGGEGESEESGDDQRERAAVHGRASGAVFVLS